MTKLTQDRMAKVSNFMVFKFLLLWPPYAVRCDQFPIYNAVLFDRHGVNASLGRNRNSWFNGNTLKYEVYDLIAGIWHDAVTTSALISMTLRRITICECSCIQCEIFSLPKFLFYPLSDISLIISVHSSWSLHSLPNWRTMTYTAKKHERN